MDTILGSVLCSTIEADPRVRDVIIELISENQLTEFNAFVNETVDKAVAQKYKVQKEVLSISEESAIYLSSECKCCSLFQPNYCTIVNRVDSLKTVYHKSS